MVNRLDDNREFKDSVLGMIPKDWDVWNIEQFCSSIADGTHESPKAVEQGYPLITSKNLKNGKIDWSDVYLIGENDYKSIIQRSYVEIGDILFGMIGTIGSPVCITEKEINIATKNVGIFRFNGDLIKSRWLFWLLNSNSIQNQIKAYLDGSTQKFLALGKLRSLSIYVPRETHEILQILKILDTVDKAIAQTETLIAKYKRVKTGLMQDLLTRGIDENGQLRDRTTHKFKRSPLGMIPVEWDVVKLSSIFQIKTGATPLRAKHELYFVGGIIPWVKTMDLNEGRITYTDEYITERALKECSVQILPPKTLLIAMYGGWEQIGRTGILKMQATTNQAISSLIPISSFVESEFIIFALQLGRNRWKELAVSTRKDPNITGNDVANFIIQLPPILEQEKIAKILDKQEQLISSEQIQLTKLQKIKTGLMQDLLSGKISVKPLLTNEP
jgi:type I restriction enzyme S subunit